MIERIKRGLEAGVATDEDEQGFTLVELLIVVVVLGILAAVTVFGLSGSTSKSNVAACNTDARSVEVAVEAFHSDQQAWPAPGSVANSGLLGPSPSGGPYLRTVPTNGRYTINIGPNGAVLVAVPAGPNGINYDDGINGTNGVTTGNPCAAVT
jgi:general secretion pathway protein G